MSPHDAEPTAHGATPEDDEPTFGRRFLDEYRNLGGPLSGFSYKEIQAIKACDREGMVRTLRASQPFISYAALRRIRTVDSPEQLARDLLFQQQAQAAAAAVGLFAMMALIH